MANKKIDQDLWFVFEEMFNVNPQTGASYAAYFDKDYLGEYLTKNLNLKNYPRHEVLFIYKNDNCKLCYNANNLEILAKMILQKTIKAPDWGISANKDIENRSDKLFEAGARLTESNFKNLSNTQLNHLYQNFYVSFLQMHTSGWYGNLVDYEEIFNNYLSKYLEQRSRKIKFSQSLPEIINILTAVNKLSNAQKEEIELLRILAEIIKSPKICDLFQKSGKEDIIKQIPKISPQIDSLLNEQVKKYGWLSYQFEGPGWGKDYFVARLKELVITKARPAKLIKEIKTRFKNAVSKQKDFFKKLKIDKKHQQLFTIFGETAFLKGYRKDSMFFGCQARDYLFKEISNRLHIPLKLLRYIYPPEMEKAIFKGFSLSLLRQRFKYHLYYYQGGVGSKILIGRQAKDFIKKLKWKKIEIKEVTELKGTCASPGRASGRVAIINIPKEINKIKKGDILVSEATSPDLMPAIKKASAIITNVGGITCHAAIVSRELGIPCVIGTKIATKVLKDGDLVEVDAERGVVKILSEK